jgi:hypothetical protein
MFPPMCTRTSNEKVSAQMMEAEISFQEAEECVRLDRVEVLRAQFAAVAQMKSAAKEKGISWSTQEPLAQGTMERGKEYTDAGVDSTDIRSTPKKRDSKHCKALQLSMERNEDIHPATPTISSACLLQAQAQTQEQQQATLVPNHNDQQPWEGTAHPSPSHPATPIHEGAWVKSNLFSDLAALRQDAMSRASFVDSVLGLTEGTPAGATPPDRPSALNSSKYPATLHNGLPTEDQDEVAHGASMFSLSHRVAPGGKGHFWFL